MTKPRLHTLIGLGAATLVFAVLAWNRRWMSDDGLIVVRTVDNILAGNGPTFNAFERAESNTSALWPWLIALVAGVTRADSVFATVVVGWLCSVAGFAIALDATRRWQLARGVAVALVPAGAFVMLGAFPFWDFATSGLESGLSTLWLAGAWWVLVRGRADIRTAVVLGLGPLVRPDFAVVTGVFLVALWLLARPNRRRTIALTAAAFAIPIAYEMFRAGYYGTLVPLPAIAKSATGSAWERGFAYAFDYVKPCLIYVPVAVLGALFVVTQRRAWPRGRDRILIGAALASALLLALFVIRVGGDFMHARMLLPATFVALLPGFVVPLTRRSGIAVALLAVWALAIGVWRGDGKSHASVKMVEDERAGYVRWTKTANPVTADPFIAATPAAAKVDAALGKHRLMSEGGLEEPSDPLREVSVVYAAGRLGTGGQIVPLDGIVVDTLGLANPLGARITVTQPGLTGHEKSLPWAWVRADFGDRGTDDMAIDGAKPADIHAARTAMQCGDLAELLASVREPMTARRFWDNLTGAISRTLLVVPSDPVEAEAKFCR